MDPALAKTALAAAPLDSEGARAFLQQRVSLLARVDLILALIIQVVVTFVHFVAGGSDLAAGSDWTVYAHLSVVMALAAIAWRTRSGRRSARELSVLDVACVAVPSSFSLVALWQGPLSVRPSFPLLIATSYLLVLRAVLVPGSGRRTATVGLVFSLVLAGWTYLHHLRYAPAEVGAAAVDAALIATWCVMGGVIIAGVASHTIFGLRRMVREAMQVGQYTLLRKIGEGGMGVVWEARHAFLRRRTAVKLLPADRAGEEAIARFEREVQLTSELTHPNTIAIYDYGRTADGVFYYAMEYLDGIDLQALVDRHGPQEPGLVAHVLAQICDALTEAHAVGLIHRDIKPANVILCERGGVPLVAKVLDFGLVKRVQSAPDAALSRADAILGTPLYMAPEAVTDPERVDARSDLYAVGAVGYFLLTGQAVFEASSAPEVMAHHLFKKPVPPSQRLGAPVPADLEALVLACLEKEPERRPATAEALAAGLRDCEADPGWTTEKARALWKDYSSGADPRVPTPSAPPRLTIGLRGRGAP